MPDIIADLDTDRLSALDDESQDFVIASHVLEHLANPLAMLGEIHRVLRSGGVALVLLPDRRRTFDRDRRPTPVQHLVAEYEADVTTVTDDHVEDFLRGVGEWQDDWSADARSEAIERHRQRSIHVHCWSQDEFSETLLHVIETGRQQWDLLDAVFVEDVVDSIEFGYVLRKLPADRDPQLVGARFREVLANLRARSSTDPRAPEGAQPARSRADREGCGDAPEQSSRRAAQQPSPSRTAPWSRACDNGQGTALTRSAPATRRRSRTVPSPGRMRRTGVSTQASIRTQHDCASESASVRIATI